jgi:hypothetical protein
VISYNWNSDFEARPTINLSRSVFDDQIRYTTRGIRERMEVEHEWGPNSGLDDGRHKKGYMQITDVGDSTARAAITNPQEGSLFLLEDSGFLKLQVYTDGAWEMVGTNYHDALAGLSDDDHPQYLKKAGGTFTGSLDAGGNAITLPNGTSALQCGLVAGIHIDKGHPGNIAKNSFDGLIPKVKFNMDVTTDAEVTFTIAPKGDDELYYTWNTLPVSNYILMPNIIVQLDSGYSPERMGFRNNAGTNEYGFESCTNRLMSGTYEFRACGDYLIRWRYLS